MAKRLTNQTGNTLKHMILLGAGYVAKRAVPTFLESGFAITATSRDGEDEELSSFGVETLKYEGGAPSKALEIAFHTATHILVSIPPKGGHDPAVEAIRELSLKNINWLGYLSATSVYGDRQGQWAFEDELLYPVNDRGRHRIEAELAWLETGLNTHIFRLAGIYGPGRSPFEKIKSGKAQAVIKPEHVVNRIYVDNIVSALMASIQYPDPGQVYNIADGHPAPPQDVLDYAADLIGAVRPPHIPLENAELSAMARSFYAETKRVSIERIKKLGWSPSFPDYKAGLTAILAEEKR